MMEVIIELLATASAAALGCIVGVSSVEIYIQRWRRRENDRAVQEIISMNREFDEKEGKGVIVNTRM